MIEKKIKDKYIAAPLVTYSTALSIVSARRLNINEEQQDDEEQQKHQQPYTS